MTVEYEITNGECFPKWVHTIVISVQHVKDDALTLQIQREALKMHVIKVSYYYVQGGGWQICTYKDYKHIPQNHFIFWYVMNMKINNDSETCFRMVGRMNTIT